MRVDLRLLLTFRAVVETAGITRAAERLNLTQSAVSAHIQRLEEDLGTVLFDRSAKGVQLTQSGELLHHYCLQILDLEQRAREQIRALEQARMGRVRIGTTDDIGIFCLPPVLDLFRERYPAVSLHIREGSTMSLIRQVRAGKLDLALMPAAEGVDGCMFTPLFELELAAVAASSHPLAAQPSVSAQDLARYPLVMYEAGCAYRQVVETACLALGQEPQVVVECNWLESIRHFVGNGMGITVLPVPVIAQELVGGLAVRPLQGMSSRLPVGLLTRTGRHMAGPVRSMVELFHEAMPLAGSVGPFPATAG